MSDSEIPRQHYEDAANNGDVDAMATLGVIAMTECDPPDPTGARMWWEKAAEVGHSGAMVNLGLLAARSDPPDLTQARVWWEKAAEAGDASGMLQLGFIALRQEGQPDLITARSWWEKAANAGYVEAMFNLGRLLATEWAPPDLDGARSWWEKAAEAGHVDAMFSLGVFFNSMAETPERGAARTWLEKAAAAGSEEAAKYLQERLGPSHAKVSDLLRRSSLGTGWYVVRDNADHPDLPWMIVDALISAGACAVQHSGMFASTTMAIAFPGGCLYQVVSSYAFFGLQEGIWLFGPTAIRHVFRILGYEQPKRRLSGETTIPDVSELKVSWDEFARQQRLDKVGLSMGALVWMRMPREPYGRKSCPEHFEPISLPVPWSRENPPPESFTPMDPQHSGSMFWTAESTVVYDATGQYRLRANGEMIRETSRD